MSARVADINGWYEVKGNPLSKVGVFPYLGRSIPGAPDPDKVYMVYRPAEELADPECIASFKLLPWVDDHTMLGDQREGLTPAEKKGIAGVIGEDVYFQNNTLFGNIKVFSEALKEQIENGKKELSCGYRCVYEQSAGVWNGQPYDFIQRRIRGNHLALVDEGRMGPDVAVLDSMVFSLDGKDLVKMADEENKEGTATDAEPMTLESLAAQVSQIMEFVNKLKPLEEAEHGAELDADETGTDDDVTDPEAPAADEDPAPEAVTADEDPAPAAMDAALKALTKAQAALKSRKANAMDAALSSVKAASDALAKAKAPKVKAATAADAAIKGLRAEVERLKKSGVKALVGEISQRDKLASDLSRHVGTFDHAEMTLAEVAAYGVGKLGIKVGKGQEMAALTGYLAAAKVPGPVATGMDAKPKMSALDKYLNGSN